LVCVDERDYDQEVDPELGRLVPQDLELVKVRSIPAKLARLAGIGDIGLRAWFSLRRALETLLQTRRIDAVFISGAPFYPMLFAPEIKRRFGVPVVLDFQDPWVSAWGEAQPPLSKAGLSHRAAMALEPRALKGASYVTSVSEIQNAEMMKRYPWFERGRTAAIPIGGDPTDFAELKGGRNGCVLPDADRDMMHISYVGTFLPRSGILFRRLFAAFASLRQTDPMLGQRIRFHFIGTSNQLSGTPQYSIKPIAEEAGVGDAVHEIPGRLPYSAALPWIAQSHGLLLVGSDEPHYTASKIYPALMSARPFLSLFHRASSAHEILRDAGGGLAFAFETPQELDALTGPLRDALRTLALEPESLGSANPAAYAHYTAAAVTRRFVDIFNEVAAESSATTLERSNI
jgi:hypothetical protein